MRVNWQLSSAVAVATLAAVGVPATAAAITTVATGQSGERVLLYRVLSQESRRLTGAIAPPTGAFGPFSVLSPPNLAGGDADMAADGTAVAAWKDMSPQGAETGAPLASVRAPGAATFGATKRLDKGYNLLNLSLAMNSRGDAVVAWSQYKGNARLALRPAGGVFGSATELPGSETRALETALDDDGGAVFVWNRTTRPAPSTVSSAILASYRTRDGVFTQPQVVADEQSFDSNQFAADRHGGALVAWLAGGELRAVERAPGGQFGEAGVAATGLSAKARILEVARADSGAAAVLLAGPYGEPAGLSVVARTAGGSWSAPELATSAASYWAADLAVGDGGQVALVTQAVDDEAVVLGRYRPPGGPFGPTEVLSSVQRVDPGRRWPAAAIGGAGATAYWEDANGETVDLLSREFGDSGKSAAVRVRHSRAYVREAPASRCTPRWGRVRARGARATVIESIRGNDVGTLYGCLFARGAEVEMLGPDGGWYRNALRVAGPYSSVAYDVCPDDEAGCSTGILITDLRDDESRFARRTSAGRRSAAQVAAVRLRADGAAAWVACDASAAGDNLVERACARPGRRIKYLYAWGRKDRSRRLVARSAAIEPRTLRIRGTRLSWRDRGRLRSTRLR